MKVWVTRDNGKHASAVTVWDSNKPIIQADGLFYPDYGQGDGMVDQMGVWTQAEYKKDFGFTPRKGSCKQYELTLTEIEE